MISKTTQEQIIRLCGSYITNKIVDDVRRSVYYSVLADETTDVSTKEQMAVVLRYGIFSDASDYKVVERFVGFIEVANTTGEALAETLWNFLLQIGLDPAYLRGQGYDGASNMAGRIKGVAARILQKNSLALYTHCCSHVLNLVIVKSCSQPEIRNMFGTVAWLISSVILLVECISYKKPLMK